MVNKWCHELVEGDNTFRKASPEQQADIVSKALAFGVWVAEAARQENIVLGSDDDTVPFVHTFGASLRLESRCLSYGRLAEYDEAAKEIICYLPIIRQVESRLNFRLPDYYNGNSLLRLCVLHELFHHLENERFGKTDQVIQLEIPLMRWFRRKSSIKGIREIAANSFVKSYLHLSYYPAELINASNLKADLQE